MSVVKIVVVLLMFIVCSLCLQDAINNGTSVEEARAKKKKNKLRVWAILAMLVVAKVAVAKVISLLLLWGFFQKFCYIIGLLLNYFMLSKDTPLMAKPAAEPTAAPPPPPPPLSPDYNTIGYSYGVPDSTDTAGVVSPDATYGTPYNNWPYSKRSKD